MNFFTQTDRQTVDSRFIIYHLQTSRMHSGKQKQQQENMGSSLFTSTTTPCIEKTVKLTATPLQLIVHFFSEASQHRAPFRWIRNNFRAGWLSSALMNTC